MNDLMTTANLLKDNLTKLPERDRQFAWSLCHQFFKKGDLSNKQQVWLYRLADKAHGIPDFTQPYPEKVQVGALSGLIAMFEKAGQKLKYPTITLQLDNGQEVRLSRAGANSKNPGFIYVKSKYAYWGKVSPDGQFMPITGLDPDVKDKVSALLRDLSRHPAEAAAKHGSLTGYCCFCASLLTDEKSVSVGYGPVCAKNWGLPWGNKAE